ncbi:S66 peptidase family protein [Curtobacterium sp. SL109]|uniref:S66 peptidase family protein n=1 Tax=Curtobacterium sp. SL109 TaxID=2994662 RepID=UPI00227646F9|nr:LD-carboxypeptidase [Curtobacterium sp. SL109]MCY1695242.1 LD-carboxypeptidase [Curtobacterium sp. SL109]
MEATRLEPRTLVNGDMVAIVSPASWPEESVPAWIARQVESWGLHAVIAPHTLDRRGYLAGSDADRAADLNQAIRDPEIRAVIASVGGCGSFRLVPDVDVDALRADPKMLVGYSDITALHQVWNAAGVPTLHGAIAGAHGDHVRRLLMEDADTVVEADRGALSAELTTSGSVEGRLFGGNLEMLARSVGVVDFDVAGGILLLEINRAAGLGMVDRALTQLRYSGALDGVVGVALGSIDQFAGYEDRGWTIVDTLRDHFDALGVPVLGGLPLGHIEDLVTVPLGTAAVLDVDHGRLTVDSPSGD